MAAQEDLAEKDLHAVRRMRGYPCKDTIEESRIHWRATIAGASVVIVCVVGAIISDAEVLLLPAFVVVLLGVPYVVNRLIRQTWYHIVVPWAYKDLAKSRRIALVLALPVFLALLAVVAGLIPGPVGEFIGRLLNGALPVRH